MTFCNSGHGHLVSDFWYPIVATMVVVILASWYLIFGVQFLPPWWSPWSLGIQLLVSNFCHHYGGHPGHLISHFWYPTFATIVVVTLVTWYPTFGIQLLPPLWSPWSLGIRVTDRSQCWLRAAICQRHHLPRQDKARQC